MRTWYLVTMSSSPSILESCRTEYVQKVVKMSIILARRRWKVSNFPKIYISLNSNCFSLGSCLSFCFVLWKQCWYSLKLKIKILGRKHNRGINLILLSGDCHKLRAELQTLQVSCLCVYPFFSWECHHFPNPNLTNPNYSWSNSMAEPFHLVTPANSSLTPCLAPHSS